MNAPLLLDGLLPDRRFARMESVVVDAPAPAVYEAARDLDLLSIHSPLFDLVTQARGLADRLLRRSPPTPQSLRVADLLDGRAYGGHPWVGLGENPGREMVFGAIGKVWQPSIEWRPTATEDFAAFHEPGWAKIAANLAVHPYGERRAVLTYEARTACTDRAAAARFTRYWALVSPGAGLVLRATLRAIRAKAEQAAPFAADRVQG